MKKKQVTGDSKSYQTHHYLTPHMPIYTIKKADSNMASHFDLLMERPLHQPPPPTQHPTPIWSCPALVQRQSHTAAATSRQSTELLQLMWLPECPILLALIRLPCVSVPPPAPSAMALLMPTMATDVYFINLPCLHAVKSMPWNFRMVSGYWSSSLGENPLLFQPTIYMQISLDWLACFQLIIHTILIPALSAML